MPSIIRGIAMAHRHALLAAALLIAGCSSSGKDLDTQEHILAVGSSTVYPFTRAVAEHMAKSNPQLPAAVVESTGTGPGITAFCKGSGPKYPDIASASRKMKPEERLTCSQHGVNNIGELQIGSDGVAFVQSKAAPPIKLTPKLVYEALAAMPYGKPNTAQKWKDVDPSLPDIAILVYGPPAGDGTHDSLIELFLKPACLANAQMKAIESDPAKMTDFCATVRKDKAYVSAGENDEQTMVKMIVNPGAVGIVGYNFLKRNAAQLQGIPISGVVPTEKTIASGKYPGSRPLFVYFKRDDLARVPGLKALLAEYAAAIAPGGYLEGLGLVPASDEIRAQTAATAGTAPAGAAPGGQSGKR